MERKIPMLDLVRLHKNLQEDLIGALQDCLNSGQFIGGESLRKFELSLAQHVGTNYGVGVSSGTDALLVGLMALGVGPGDEVITTPYTFFATAGSIVRLGARPVFVDIDPVTFNLDPSAVAAAITSRTQGIIPVHLFGQCAEMEPILATAEKHHLWVIEDAAQAIGARCGELFAGAMGTIGTFSFFPAKNLGALGDGGAVVTDDEALASKIISLRGHGAAKKYYHEMVGGNFRLDAIQAAFLLAKLPHLRSWEEGRRKVAVLYRERLGEVEAIGLPEERPHTRHVYNQFVIRVGEARDELAGVLRANGIGSAIYYPVPLHLQKCFSHLGYANGSFENAEKAALSSLALPIDPLLTEEEITIICNAIRKVFR